MEYYSSIAKNEVLICYNIDEPFKHYANERSQIQKTTYYVIPYIGMSTIVKSIEKESSLGIARGRIGE